jgi:hypothetical protein
MPDPELNRIAVELESFGVPTDSIRWLGASASPDLIEYLDLVEPRKQHDLLPDVAAENRGRPLLFFVNERRLSEAPHKRVHDINRLRRLLASRGDRAYLAVLLPGQLEVTPISLDEVPPEWKTYRAGTQEAQTLFPRLSLGKYDGEGEPVEADFVFNKMLELLMSAADRLGNGLENADVISLIGRALFFRFLYDRHVITDYNGGKLIPSTGLLGCFDTAESAAATSQWLDRTFNGDFLPLTDNGSVDFFDRAGSSTNGKVFSELGAILRGKQSDDYQLTFDWAAFDFAHVPVGLLSQVHEAFCWKWEHRDARETSVYYTPRKIANIIVSEAFDNLPDAYAARMLDPACGAGIFLTLAFRRFYRERWKKLGERPDTSAIREILERQLTGFDISESALRLAALSLYLTAVELDPEPIPPEKLRFQKLRNQVLFNWRLPDDPDKGAVIGSLGPHVGTGFDGKYNLILSNPPWTSVSGTQEFLKSQFTVLSKEIIQRRGGISLAQNYQNPDSAPDLPFLWRSTEWCAPGGRIAMALPARILFKQEDIPLHARKTLFKLLDITGIINGSNLSDTKVWPDMQQPFMLLFAKNVIAPSQHTIQFITPHCDTVLNQVGEVRIDSKSTRRIEPEATIEESWLWKALAVGTSLDADIVRKVTRSTRPPLYQYWVSLLNLKSSAGYIIAENQKQEPAAFLAKLRNLDSSEVCRFFVRPEDSLSYFSRTTAHRPRKEEIYEPPLVLVKEAPGLERERGWSLLSFEKIAYSVSFYGYSAAGHPDGEFLVRYLHLFAHSLIWLHYALMTSAKFGVERRRFYKSDFDGCPLVPIEDLSPMQRAMVQSLSYKLELEDTSVFSEIDSFFGDLYGLESLDLEVIRDSLEVSLPYDECRKRASFPPSPGEVITFCKRLESLLRPFFAVLRKDPQIEVWERTSDDNFSPFGVLLIGEQSRPLPSPDQFFKKTILPLANETGVTSIVQPFEHGLIVGVLNQYRYWTPSRARLMAAEILHHSSLFED